MGRASMEGYQGVTTKGKFACIECFCINFLCQELKRDLCNVQADEAGQSLLTGEEKA